MLLNPPPTPLMLREVSGGPVLGGFGMETCWIRTGFFKFSHTSFGQCVSQIASLLTFDSFVSDGAGGK